MSKPKVTQNKARAVLLFATTITAQPAFNKGRYLSIFVFLFQGKFPVAPHNVEARSDTPGNNIQTRSLVVLNALGFIGFKVLGVAGTCQVNKSTAWDFD